MRVFIDVFSGDELFSDAYPYNEDAYDGYLIEVKAEYTPKKNEQIAKTDLLQTEAADLPEGEEEQQNSQMVNQEHSSPEKIDLVQSSDKMACEMD